MYSVGDIVTVREDLHAGHNYGAYSATELMSLLAGKDVEIRRVLREESDLYLIADSTCIWTPEMFQSADIEESDIPIETLLFG